MMRLETDVRNGDSHSSFHDYLEHKRLRRDLDTYTITYTTRSWSVQLKQHRNEHPEGTTTSNYFPDA